MMLRTTLVAAALTFGFMVPMEASACEVSCPGGSCSGTGTCECTETGMPKCSDQPKELEPVGVSFARVAGNAAQFERAVASQLGGSSTLNTLMQAVRDGELAMLRSDGAAYATALQRTLEALRALTSEQQQVINDIASSM